MSKHFTAINRKTGKQWKSQNGSFLVMYDSGYLAEVVHSEVIGAGIYSTNVIPLDIKEWKMVLRKPMQAKLEKFGIWTGEGSAENAA